MKKPLLIISIVTGIIILLLVLNFFILKNTNEYYQHNLFGNTDNIVLLHPDGHEEVVIDIDGNSVEEGSNSPSYNFCHPIEDPICHFTKDTWPWIKWGNSIDDESTKSQRWNAFMRDYYRGFLKLF